MTTPTHLCAPCSKRLRLPVDRCHVGSPCGSCKAQAVMVGRVKEEAR
jgi:hypothetical protein